MNSVVTDNLAQLILSDSHHWYCDIFSQFFFLRKGSDLNFILYRRKYETFVCKTHTIVRRKPAIESEVSEVSMWGNGLLILNI